MKHLKRIVVRLRKKQGGYSYVGTLLMIFIAVILLLLFLNVLFIAGDYFKVVGYTNTMVDNASRYGCVENDDTYTAMAGKFGLDASRVTYSWDAQYYDQAAGKLAFKQPFTLTVTCSCKLLLFLNTNSGVSFSIPVTYVGKGISGMFWKT